MMNKEKYMNQRNEMMAEVEQLMADGNVQEANSKMDEIKALDEKWEEIAKANANLEALRGEQKPLSLEGKSVELKGDEMKMDQMNILEKDPMEIIASTDYKNAFLKKLQGKSLSKQENALVTASGAIPTQTMNKIVEKMEKIAPILAKIDLSHIPSNLSIPVEDATADAAWVAMATDSTDSADSISTVDLAAYKLIKTVSIGADVSVMAIDAFETYLVNKLAKKMAKALENAVINGTGSGQPTGLLATGIITNTGEFTNAGMTFADIVTIIGDLPDDGYRDNACFVMPSTLFFGDVISALVDKGSGLDVQALVNRNILGYEVILCDRVAADTLIFGDLESYAMNMAQDVAIESDKSAGFRSGSTVYRSMALVDGKPTNVAAFNKYTRAAS